MGEIKYRAWNKKTKTMHEVTALDFSGRVERWVYFKDAPSAQFADVELMQFTGLHDKAAKEIYEGDIVSVTFDGEVKTNFSVKWNETNAPEFCFSNKRGDLLSHTGWQLTKSRPEFYEVIGNIYETPELLK